MDKYLKIQHLLVFIIIIIAFPPVTCLPQALISAPISHVILQYNEANVLEQEWDMISPSCHFFSPTSDE